jgi:hypothetical protein
MSKPFVDRVMNLTQGISRQAAPIRYPGQVEDATNVEFSVVDGARKRKGSAFLGFLGSASATNSYRMHRIERDDDEEYVVVYGRGFLKIFDVNTQQTAVVDYEPGAISYLFANGPSAEQLRFSTVADTTFVVNQLVIPRMESDNRTLDPATMPMILTRDSYSPDAGARFTMKQATWPGRSANYQILRMDGTATEGSFKIKYGDEKTLDLPFDANAEQIQRALEGNGYEPKDFLVEERRTVSSTEGSTQTTTTELTGEYIDVDLPPDKGTIDGKAVAGLGAFNYGKVIVTGGPINDRAVYVKISPDIQDTIAFQVTDNTTGREITVEVGDSVNDPPPAFAQDPSKSERIGLPISDISYVRNRLAISCDEFVCFSRTDDVFSFFKEEPPTLIASDAFDIQLAADDVCIIDRMVQFRGAIVLLTRSGQQFEISGLETLSASEAAATPSTKYNTKNAMPAQVGERLYMLGEGKGNTRMLEYYYSDASVSNTSLDVSKHVDDLIPETSLALASNPNRETVFVVTELANDLTSREYVSDCDDDTALDWDACPTWDNEGIPQPWDTAVIRPGCVVYRSDDDYAESDCVGGLAARPKFQTATARRNVCCDDLAPAARIPCNTSGTNSNNCNCFPNNSTQCRCNTKQRGLFGCDSLLSKVTNFFNREDPPLDCVEGSCCIGGLCQIVCQAECRDLGGTWTSGGSCIGDPCGGLQTPGPCCLPTGECVMVNNSGVCDALGGTFNAGGLNCSTVVCNEPCNSGGPLVPCCLDGNCFMETADCCADAGGTVQAGSNCAGVSCPTGAGEGCLPNCGDPGSDYGDPTNAGISGQMYVYQTYMEGQERKQSAWSKWSFGKDRLMDAVVIDDELITLRKQTLAADGAGTVLILEATDLSGSTDAPVVTVGNATYTWPHPVHLDHMTVISNGIYDSGVGYTRWALSQGSAYPSGYTDFEIDTVVQTDGTAHSVIAAADGQEIRTTENVDLTGAILLVGRAVDAQMTLTESFARDRERKPILDGRTTLKKVVITHKDARKYDVIVSSTTPNALTRTNSYSASGIEEAGEVVTWTQGNTETTSVTLKSSNPYPNTWTSYEFHGLLSHQIDGGA